MRFALDHDLHIHSYLSDCSRDPEQNTETILSYAKQYHLKTICLTDHFWDETIPGEVECYRIQNYPHICRCLPLPQAEGIRFLFGCETELNRFLTLGISKQRMEELDFIIIPTTHFHFRGETMFEEELASVDSRAKAWVRRLDGVLNMDLPFHKIGIAHPTCTAIGIGREEYLQVIEALPENEMKRLFTKAAKLGCGIELNSDDMSFSCEEADIVLRPYRIAKECGCKFYLGSDAHHPAGLHEAIPPFKRAIELLELDESDKFIV